jgi:hypothetical protein
VHFQSHDVSSSPFLPHSTALSTPEFEITNKRCPRDIAKVDYRHLSSLVKAYWPWHRLRTDDQTIEPFIVPVSWKYTSHVHYTLGGRNILKLRTDYIDRTVEN